MRCVAIALIDAIGPFFQDCKERRINWSKIPFLQLATEGRERDRLWEAIRRDTEIFAERVAGLGFNTVSLDDVAHLSLHPWLEGAILERNRVFREEFRTIFAIFKTRGLAIYLTADFITSSDAVDGRIGRSPAAATAWFREVVEDVLDSFPEVSGIILRIGESDGHDVDDPLRSRLILRTARQANAMLQCLLPVFEERGRVLVFRTWTVGAHLIGDLIWNRGRLAAALRNITSTALVVSMKYGESDFFRYLPLNRHFFRIEQPKLVELQARREYEGAGEYPSFVGWDCEACAGELGGAPNMAGFSVWCQTGGWHAFRRRAFLEPGAVWIDMNTEAILRIFRDGASVEKIVNGWFPGRPEAVEMFRLLDAVIRKVLYIEDFARQELFFRRVRIPPLLHVYWDSLFINEPVRRVLRHFVADPEGAIRSGEAAFSHFDRIAEIASRLGLPPEDIQFMKDTFALILLARRYYFLPFDLAFIEEIRAAKRAYKTRWPRAVRQRYRIRIDPGTGNLHWRTFN